MPLRTQKQVMANLDKLNGKAMRAVGEEYRAGVIAPLVEVLNAAGDGQAAMRMLNAGLLRRMDADALEQAVAETQVQSALIGRVSALPKTVGHRP